MSLATLYSFTNQSKESFDYTSKDEYVNESKQNLSSTIDDDDKSVLSDSTGIWQTVDATVCFIDSKECFIHSSQAG